MDRRTSLKFGGGTCLASAVPKSLLASQSSTPFVLTSEISHTNILGSGYPDTDVWRFNGGIPGPPIRIPLGQRVDVRFDNRLSEPSSVHWHGIRVPNAMDGVAGLTQKAVLPGESFQYTFTPPDAGTFWYHSHLNASEQVDRGLYGPLVISEPNPHKSGS